jgi:nascent polypeptide-associated complex subunit alpha
VQNEAAAVIGSDIMMPNIDPRTMRNMMARMGIKSSEINADKVSIECPTKTIIIENPQVTLIEAQGTKSFQITGDISEIERSVAIDISEDDVKMVMERSGASEEASRNALEGTGGDIAAAILKLGQDKDQ